MAALPARVERDCSGARGAARAVPPAREAPPESAAEPVPAGQPTEDTVARAAAALPGAPGMEDLHSANSAAAGCSCHTAPGPGDGWAGVGLLVLALAGLLRRRPFA